MSKNLFSLFRRALEMDAPLLVGEVTAVGDGGVTVELPGGGVLQARGAATVGDKVFVRDGVVEGQAPDLSIEVIEV